MMMQGQGLLGAEMEQPQQPEAQGQGGLPRTPGTFLTLQLMLHFFEPEQAQQWIQAASGGNAAAVISQLALAGIQEGMSAAGGKVSQEEAIAALQEVITAMVLLLVSTGKLPQDQAEQTVQEALRLAMGGAGQEQQPMPPQQPGGMMQ